MTFTQSHVLAHYLRIADEHIECMASFRFPDADLRDSSSASQSPLSVSGAPALPMVDSSPLNSFLHHINMSGLQTRCILDVDYIVGDVIECQGCLDEMSAALPDRATLASLLDTIRGSESQGVTIFGLLVRSWSRVACPCLIVCLGRSTVSTCKIFIERSIHSRRVHRLSYIVFRTAPLLVSLLLHIFVPGLQLSRPSQKMLG
jgi:hypothetical protein